MEESEEETPYDGGEDERAKAGIRSYLVVSMSAYGQSKRDRNKGTKKREGQGGAMFIIKWEEEHRASPYSTSNDQSRV